MFEYRCKVCNYLYNEFDEEKIFRELPNYWKCPVCKANKDAFIKIKTLNNFELNNSEDNILNNVVNSDNSDISFKTISDVLVEQMSQWGIKYVFGIPGTSSLGIVDAVRKNEDMEYFQVRHEQTAAMMASAYGKLTGNIAACLTITGPGATNLATGLYDAKLDKSPVLAITGYVQSDFIGNNAFQEINQHEFFEAITVFNQTINNSNQTTRFATLGIKHSLIEKGVSNISIPADIQKEKCNEEVINIEGNLPIISSTAPEYIINKAVNIINKVERPVIVVGKGAMENKEDIKDLAEKISAPIVYSFKGKGITDDDYFLNIGGHGGIGTLTSDKITKSSDLLIIIGCSCSNNTNLPARPAIQIDIDPMAIGKRFPIDLSIVGNSGEIVPKILEKVNQSKKIEYLEEIASLKRKWNEILEKEEDPNRIPLKFPYIMKELSENVDDNAIIAIDVGENAWRVGRNFPMKETQKHIISGYLATMGFGLPSSLAAQIVYPERKVICITGDGGFSMVMGDFLTAVKYNLPVKVFLFNNHELGMIKGEQRKENYPNWNTHLYNCDFAEYANNCGGLGLKAKTSQELKIAIKTALSSDIPVIVDIETDPDSFD